MPSGSDETVLASDFLDALNALFQTQEVIPLRLTEALNSQKTLDASAQVSNALGLAISADGSALYVSDTSSDTVYQYALSKRGDIGTGSYASKSLDVSAQTAIPDGIEISPDGAHFFVVGSPSIHRYDLGTPGDISTASFVESEDVSAQGGPDDVTLSDDGTTMLVEQGSGFVHQYSLGTPWTPSTATYDNVSLDLNAALIPVPVRLNLVVGGSALLIASSAETYLYDLPTPNSLTGAVLSQDTYAFEGMQTSVFAFCSRRDGTVIYAVDSTGLIVRQYYINRVVSA